MAAALPWSARIRERRLGTAEDYTHPGELTVPGNVGIGTTSPDAKLSAVGVVRGAYDASETEHTVIRHGWATGYINSVGDGGGTELTGAPWPAVLPKMDRQAGARRFSLA